MSPAQDTPTISASRLKMVGKCERMYAGAYGWGLKQASTPALERGTALHSAAEHYQDTGEIEHPESAIGTLLAAGTHLLECCGKLLVEYEHQGELPDGTPYIAYFDGHSETADPQLGTVIVQDLKTTGSAARALTAETLLKDEQAMFYAWILLCSVHRFRKDEQSEWQVWDPKERFARSVRLRWIYFLTAGNPRAWESTVPVLPAAAEAYMQGTIMPLVRRIRAIHDWRATNPGATLDDYARNMDACDGEGKWCGVGEREACEMHIPGTPAIQLIQLRTRNPNESERNTMTDNERMNALRAKYASKATPSAAVVVAAPEPTPEPIVEAAVEETLTPAPVASVEAPVVEAPVRPRKPRTPAPAAPPEGAAGVNPPEAVEALAKLNAEIIQPAKATASRNVVVRTGGNSDSHAADDFTLSSAGFLYVKSDGRVVALYAPGSWSSVTLP
jgi:hypothetical protein